MKTLYYQGEEIDEYGLQEIKDIYELPSLTIDEIIKKLHNGEEVLIDTFPNQYQSEIADLVECISDKKEETQEAIVVSQQKAETDPSDLVAEALTQPLRTHFILTPDNRSLKINRDNPPSVEEAHQTFFDLFNLTSVFEYAKDKSSWLLGSLIIECENEFGESFNPSQLIETTNKSYNTIYTAAKVAKEFPPEKRSDLSYTHHKEVFFSRVPSEDRIKTLEYSEQLNLNAKELRSLCKVISQYGIEYAEKVNTKEELIETSKKLDDSWKEFIIEEENLWKKIKVKATDPTPKGITVIDLEKMEVTKDGSTHSIQQGQEIVMAKKKAKKN